MIQHFYKSSTALSSTVPLPASTEGNGLLVCMYNMGLQVEACGEQIPNNPVCDENSPDFAVRACLQEMMKCTADGLDGFRQCIE